MNFSWTDVEAGVSAATVRVAGIEPPGSVEPVYGEVPRLTERIGTAIGNESGVQWRPAGIRFASEILASALLIRLVRHEDSSEIMAASELPNWIKPIINRW